MLLPACFQGWPFDIGHLLGKDHHSHDQSQLWTNPHCYRKSLWNEEDWQRSMNLTLNDMRSSPSSFFKYFFFTISFLKVHFTFYKKKCEFTLLIPVSNILEMNDSIHNYRTYWCLPPHPIQFLLGCTAQIQHCCGEKEFIPAHSSRIESNMAWNPRHRS